MVATQRETFPTGTQYSVPGPLASASGDSSGTAAVGPLGESRHPASLPQRWKMEGLREDGFGGSLLPRGTGK